MKHGCLAVWLAWILLAILAFQCAAESAPAAEVPAAEETVTVSAPNDLQTFLRGCATAQTKAFKVVYTDELSFDDLSDALYRAGVLEFNWKLDRENKTYTLSDVIYEEGIRFCDSSRDLTELAKSEDSFICSYGTIALTEEWMTEILRNCGFQPEEAETVTFTPEYNLVRVENGKRYAGFKTWRNHEQGQEDAEDTALLTEAQEILKLVDPEEGDLERQIFEAVCRSLALDAGEMKYADMFYLCCRLSGLDAGYAYGEFNGEPRIFNQVRTRLFVDVYAADRDKDLKYTSNGKEEISHVICYAWYNFTPGKTIHPVNLKSTPVMKTEQASNNAEIYETAKNCESIDDAVSFAEELKKQFQKETKRKSVDVHILVDFEVSEEEWVKNVEKKSEWVKTAGAKDDRFVCICTPDGSGNTYIDIYFRY